MDLEVPLEMLQVGVSSDDNSATTFDRSQLTIDPSKYDGTITATWEIVAINGTAGALDVKLMDGPTEVASISVPGGNVWTRLDASFTWPSSTTTYKVKTPADSDNTAFVDVMRSRIKVKQVGATKTRIQNQLLAGGFSTDLDVDSSTVALQGGFDTAFQYGFETSIDDADEVISWEYKAARWGTIAGFSFEGLLFQADSPAPVTKVALFKVSDDTKVTNSEASSSGAGLSTFSQALTTSDLAADTDYAVKMLVGEDDFAGVFAAFLYIDLDELTKLEVPYEYGFGGGTSITKDHVDARAFLDLDDFSDVSEVLAEFQGRVTAGDWDHELIDAGTNDSGTSGTSEVTIDVTETKLQVKRSADLGLTGSSRYFAKSIENSGTGSMRLRHARLIVFLEESGGTLVGKVVYRLGSEIKSSFLESSGSDWVTVLSVSGAGNLDELIGANAGKPTVDFRITIDGAGAQVLAAHEFTDRMTAIDHFRRVLARGARFETAATVEIRPTP